MTAATATAVTIHGRFLLFMCGLPTRKLSYFSQQLPAIDYPWHFLVKRITNAGTFRLKNRLLFIANGLKQHHIGLDETDDGVWSIYFRRVLLAMLDERDYIIRD